MLKYKLIEELKNHFGTDKLNLEQNLKVTECAAELIKLFKTKYPNENLSEQVIIYSAILHDLGLKQDKTNSENNSIILKKLKSSASAKDLISSLNIESLNIDFQTMEEIAQIVIHHHKAGKVSSNNFKILYDAEWIIKLEDNYQLNKLSEKEKDTLIEEKLISDLAKNLARKRFLK